MFENIDVLTVREGLAFYSLCKENYSLTEDYIKQKKHNQRRKYIQYAECVGHSTSNSEGEPNQRFHFLESWALRSLLDGTINLDESFYAVVNSKIKCKELILWMLEAAGCAPKSIEEFEKTWHKNCTIGLFVSEDDLTKCIKERMLEMRDNTNIEQYNIAVAAFRVRSKCS